MISEKILTHTAGYLPVSENMNSPKFQSLLQSEERLWLRELVGAAAYTLLASSTEDAELEQLRESGRFALAFRVMALHWSALQLTVGNRGITTAKSEKDTSAYEYQMVRAANSWAELSARYAEELLYCMEASPLFDFWLLSDEGTVRGAGSYIRDTASFQRHFNIQESRQLFQALRPCLVKAESDLSNMISAGENARLRAALAGGVLTAEEQGAVDLIRPWIVYTTLLFGARQLRIQFTASGLMLESTRSTTISGTERSHAAEQQAGGMLSTLYQLQEEAAQRLSAYMHSNSDFFPDFRAAKQPTTTPPTERNDDTRIFIF